MAARVTVRAGDALSLPKVQDRGGDEDRHCYNLGEHIDLSQSNQSPSSSGETTSLGRLTHLFQWQQKTGWK